MNAISSFFKTEIEYFQRLTTDGRKLISSIALYNVASPLFQIFLNAFLWRESHDLKIVTLYNITFRLGIPIGFYFAGLLLKKYRPSSLYLLSCLALGVSASLLIFFTTITFISVSLFGILFGVGFGLFWASRNLLTLRFVDSEHRIYFASLESSSGTVLGIFIPILIGWFITFGGNGGLYTPIQAYQLISLLMLVVLFISGTVIKSSSVTNVEVNHIFLKKSDEVWKKYRVFAFINGLLDGLIGGFLPTLMILTFIGQENALGTIQSLTALIAVIITYNIGKKIATHKRLPLMVISIFFLIAGSLGFSILYSALGVIFFLTLLSIANPLYWVSASSLNYDLIERENQDGHHYSYIFDQELFVSAGRVFSTMVFFLFLILLPSGFALRFSMLVFATSQALLLLLAKAIERQIKVTT